MNNHAEALVRRWPALGEAPWLGHDVREIVVLPRERIRITVGGGVSDLPLLIADERLSWIGGGPTSDSDVRDQVDRDSATIITRHTPSVRYARTLGREVEQGPFDRLYVLVLSTPISLKESAWLGTQIGTDWADLDPARRPGG